MVRKTRKNLSHKKNKNRGVYSIPELRRSFEHIERFVDDKIHKKESSDKITRDLRKEWTHVFMKELDKKSAEAFIGDRMKHTGSRRTTRRQGGGAAIAGAPLDYSTRAGVYLAPESIPDKAGHLPLSGGAPSNFGSYIGYVDKGFQVSVPMSAQSFDPVKGQTTWPQVPVGMGSNAVHFPQQKGGRNKGSKRKIRRGGGVITDQMGATISQAFSHPMGSASPPSMGQDMQDRWYGRPVGSSPDQVQRQVDYRIGNSYPKPINFI